MAVSGPRSCSSILLQCFRTWPLPSLLRSPCTDVCDAPLPLQLPHRAGKAHKPAVSWESRGVHARLPCVLAGTGSLALACQGPNNFLCLHFVYLDQPFSSPEVQSFCSFPFLAVRRTGYSLRNGSYLSLPQQLPCGHRYHPCTASSGCCAALLQSLGVSPQTSPARHSSGELVCSQKGERVKAGLCVSPRTSLPKS